MASSGVAVFNPNIIELMEEAYERAGLTMRSGYDLKTGIRSFNFMMAEWANRGLNLWTIQEVVVPVSAGQQNVDIENVVDVTEVAVRQSINGSPTDYRLERIALGQWAAMPNKTAQGRPTRFYGERLADKTRIKLWPVPQSDQFSIVYWALTRIDDAGAPTNTADMPYRFIPALVAGLAYHIATKKPEAMERVPYLKQEYETQFALAAEEDRDRSSIFLLPDVY